MRPSSSARSKPHADSSFDRARAAPSDEALDTADVTLRHESDLPQPRDAFDEKLLEDVRRYGCHCVRVADEHHPEHAVDSAALASRCSERLPSRTDATLSCFPPRFVLQMRG
jgi:hypothetical protein